MQTIATSPTTRRGVLIENLMTSSTSATFDWATLMNLAEESDRRIDERDPEPLVNLEVWINVKWDGKNSNSDIVDSQIYYQTLIKQLIDEIETKSRQKRGGNYYHGAICPTNIVVSEDGKLSLTDSSNCDQKDGSLTEIEHESQFLYLPNDLQSNQKALLDPTVDELAFVRTVYQMVHPSAEFTMIRSWTILDDPRGQKETHLSWFLKGVARRLYSELRYSQDKAKFEDNFKNNQAVVLDAIREEFPWGFLTPQERSPPNFMEGDDFRNVYSAVKRILKHNWNELFIS